MTVDYRGLAAGLSVVFSAFLLEPFGITGLAGTILLGVGAVLGMIFWTWSPLPNNNGGMLSADPGRYWGFSKPDE